jgi:VWFA-related protein
LRRFIFVAAVGFVAALSAVAAQQPTFRAARELVSIDVVVRDRMGNIVRGLTAADFDVREDGKSQDVETFSFQEINAQSVAAGETSLLAGVEAQVTAAAGGATQARTPQATPANFSPDALAGRRLWMLLFDVSSMEPEDVQRAVDSAAKYVSDQMSAEDLIAVATVGSTLNVITDFTGDRAAVSAALSTLAATEGTAVPEAAANTAQTDEAAAAAADAQAAEASEFDTFNNDARLRALKVVADALAPLQQKKAVIYFSAGLERSGEDNQVELRAATNAAVRANLSIYAVDTRGLQAVVPGGDARQASRGGQGLFSGRGVSQQFDRLASSQDTLVSLAADTGGRAFTDSNDFSNVFTQVRRDISGYYLLGYSSTNPAQDGRFRRIQVRLKRSGDFRLEARNGYYAERDFAHTASGDRETQLRTELDAAVSSTDVPVLVTTGWFRLANDRYYVPIAVAVPGSAVPVDGAEAVVDVLGQVRDEQGRPIGRMRETLKIPSGGAPSLAGKQVLYQSGVTLPPGRFSVKVVVRENAGGTIGSFEAPVIVPELRQASLKVSSVVLSTQLQPWTKGRTDNPLVRDGIQMLPNLTRVVGKSQKLYFYYEVYEPASTDAAPPLVRTSLAFYRGKVKVFETPVVERDAIDVPDRKASLFQFELPPDSLAPGLYTCQINIVDAVAAKFSFPRLTMLVR